MSTVTQFFFFDISSYKHEWKYIMVVSEIFPILDMNVKMILPFIIDILYKSKD